MIGLSAEFSGAGKEIIAEAQKHAEALYKRAGIGIKSK